MFMCMSVFETKGDRIFTCTGDSKCAGILIQIPICVSMSVRLVSNLRKACIYVFPLCLRFGYTGFSICITHVRMSIRFKYVYVLVCALGLRKKDTYSMWEKDICMRTLRRIFVCVSVSARENCFDFMRKFYCFFGATIWYHRYQIA